MNDKSIWQYLSNKTLDELNRYTLNVDDLYDDISKNRLCDDSKTDPHKLLRDLKNIVLSANFMSAHLSQFKIADISGDELEILLPALTSSDQSFILSPKDAEALTQELEKLDHEHQFAFNKQDKKIQVSIRYFVINRYTAKKLLPLMGECINPDSKELKPAHDVFNKMRLQLSDLDHRIFFGCTLTDKGPFKLQKSEQLDTLIDMLFHPDNSSEPLLTHQQLWELSKKLTTAENRRLFGVKQINLDQDANLSSINWRELIRLAKHHDVRFELQPYQYDRIMRNLKLEQAMDLINMVLSKTSEFSVHSLKSASQYMAYYMQNTGFMMKIIALFPGGSMINWSVTMQRAAYVPILGLVSLLTAKQSYDDEHNFELKTRKSTVIAFFRTSLTHSRNKTELKSTQRPPLAQVDFTQKERLYYYNFLKDLVKNQKLELPCNINDIEQEFLDKGKERELLFYLTDAIVRSPNYVAPRPILKAFVDEVKSRMPGFLVHSTHKVARSAFNPYHQPSNTKHMEMQWLLFKQWFAGYYIKVAPYIGPTVSSIIFTVLMLFIVALFTTQTAYLVTAGVILSGIGSMVWVMSYMAEQNKQKMIAINERNLSADNKEHLESEYIKHHQELCKIIDEMVVKSQPNPVASNQPTLSNEALELARARELIKKLETENAQLKQGTLSGSIATHFAQPSVNAQPKDRIENAENQLLDPSIEVKN